MTREEFTATLNRLKSVVSESGNNYHDLSVSEDRLNFRREDEFVTESIPIEELYEFYTSGKQINRITAKGYITGSHQAPAADILSGLPKPDDRTEYHEFHSKTDKIGEGDQSPAAKEFENPSEDERRFFSIFSEIMGTSHLRSRSLGRPVSSEELFLSNNYLEYAYPEEINDIYVRIMEALLSEGRFFSESITDYVDGLIVDHPQLHNRIVAFDEEEHFTPARRDSLLILSASVPLGFRDRYISLCSNLDYLRGKVFQKYRIDPETLAGLPETFARFAVWLQSAGEENTGHMEEKTPFGFGGGRMAQRAYYDSLTDTAHLSEKNQNFEPSIRFAKKSFEDIAGSSFRHIPDDKVKEIAIQLLKSDYEVASKGK